MNRLLNACSAGLLIYYLLFQWTAMMSSSPAAGWAELLMGVTAMLLVGGVSWSNARPTVAILLVLLVLLLIGLGVYSSTTRTAAASALTGLFEAPTIFLAICVTLAGERLTTIPTLVAVLLVAGSGAWAYQGARHIALGAIGVMFVSCCQLLLVIPLTGFVSIRWSATTLREKLSVSPDKPG